MNKENTVIEEIKELANQIVEKIEGLTVKESNECEDLMRFYRDVKWFLEPPRKSCMDVAQMMDKALK